MHAWQTSPITGTTFTFSSQLKLKGFFNLLLTAEGRRKNVTQWIEVDVDAKEAPVEGVAVLSTAAAGGGRVCGTQRCYCKQQPGRGEEHFLCCCFQMGARWNG